MEPARYQIPAEWMSEGRTRRLLNALGAGNALFVGGGVRDWIMGRPGGDIDVATVLTPDAVQARLKEAGIHTVPTGIEHGTITAVVDGKGFEVTTLRRDVATDGRRAMVAYTGDWAEDARRRDFTVNTLLADERGNIYDPLKQGLNDLADRRLRFVGDARARIAEDYLRILRYFRFAAQFGWDVSGDDDTLAACREGAAHIDSLSRERITQEVLKLLAADDPVPALTLMDEHHIVPELLRGYDARMMAALDTRNPLTRLALLDEMYKGLILSNEKKRFIAQVREAADALADEGEAAARRLVYHFGNRAAGEGYRLRCARKNKAPQAALVRLMDVWKAPVFPLKGEDLIAQGFKPGPELGRKLKELEREWLAQIAGG